MRLSQVITPELILGTRGSAEAIDTYKTALAQISKVDGRGGGMLCSPAMHNLDDITRGHFAMSFKFKNESPKVYQVGKEFAQALAEVDRNIPIDKLPQRFFGYFSFPQGTFTEPDGGNVRGGFVFIGPWYETVCKPLPGDEDRAVWISYDCDTPQVHNRFFVHTASLLLPIEGTDFTAAIEHAPALNDAKEKASKAILRTLVNLAMYVKSTDPSLLPTRPAQETSISQRKKFYNKHGASNLCTVPVTFVSWNYKRPARHFTDHTTVKGHFRWQPHGPGFSLVKLIWIDEHERHFNLTENKTEGEL